MGIFRRSKSPAQKVADQLDPPVAMVAFDHLQSLMKDERAKRATLLNEYGRFRGEMAHLVEPGRPRVTRTEIRDALYVASLRLNELLDTW